MRPIFQHSHASEKAKKKEGGDLWRELVNAEAILHRRGGEGGGGKGQAVLVVSWSGKNFTSWMHNAMGEKLVPLRPSQASAERCDVNKKPL